MVGPELRVETCAGDVVIMDSFYQAYVASKQATWQTRLMQDYVAGKHNITLIKAAHVSITFLVSILVHCEYG